MNEEIFIPKTEEPHDCYSGYQRRMERNDWELKKIAKEIIKINPEIEVYFYEDDNMYQKNVVFFKGENINTIQFHEAPYHWSGCSISNHNGFENCSMPFTVDDVLTTFHPITVVIKSQPNEHFKSKEQYLKWHSFYKRWGVENAK